MNVKNLMMWGIIVALVVGLFQMFQSPQQQVQNSSKVPFSSFLKNLTFLIINLIFYFEFQWYVLDSQ